MTGGTESNGFSLEIAVELECAWRDLETECADVFRTRHCLCSAPGQQEKARDDCRRRKVLPVRVMWKGPFCKGLRCCDDACSARVLFASPTDYVLRGDHRICTFDHEKELRRRTRLELARQICSRNVTDSPSEVVRKMEVTMRLCPEEKRSVKTFVSELRKKEFGVIPASGARVQIPDVLKVVKRDMTIEDEASRFFCTTAPTNTQNRASSSSRRQQ